MRANGWLRLASFLLLVALGSWAVPAKAQSLQVTSANPDTAPQGSTNLIVKIGGSGFKKGAKSAFYVSGTTNPGGITVNSTTYVSNSEVDANITIASDATLSNFDIYVTSGGRTGKGWNLFSVTSNPNSNSGCVSQGPAAGWTQVAVLNPADSNGTPLYTVGKFGFKVRVQLVSAKDANGNLVPQFYVGLVSAGGGQTIAFVLNLDGTVRRSWVVLNNYGAGDIVAGDVNGDGVPDFVSGSPDANMIHLFIGHLTGSVANGNLDYNIDPSTDVFALSAPSGAGHYFGSRVAMGDLNGDGYDEVVTEAGPSGTSKHAIVGAAYIYDFNYDSTTPSNSTWSLLKQISDPAHSTKDSFGGSGLSIGELTTVDGNSSGTRVPDLVVGASSAGLAYVFQNPLNALNLGSLPTLTFPIASSNGYASQAGVADVTGDGFPDLVVVGGENPTPEEAEVFAGPLSGNESPTNTLYPDPSLAAGWGTSFSVGDIDGDGKADVLVGAPNATYSSSCTSTLTEGAAYVFRTNSAAFPGYSDLFEMPDSGGGYGWGVAAVPFTTVTGQPIVLIGEKNATVGTQAGAGQVYIYRKTQ